MKVKFVQFSEACRIVEEHASSNNTYLSEKDYDIDLIDYSYFEVRRHGSEAILVIVPFNKAIYVTPQQVEEFTDLNDADHQEDEGSELLGPDQLPAIPVKGRVRSKAHGRSGN